MRNVRLRVAWFSPLPPQQDRVAEYSMRMLSSLKRYIDIDVFVENPSLHQDTPMADEFPILNFTDFSRLRSERHYDLNVYNFANEPSCLFTCLALLDFPGVMVLHELPLECQDSDRLPELRADERAPGPGEEGNRDGPLYSFLQRLIDSSLGIIVGNDHLKREVLKCRPRGPVMQLGLETGYAKAFSDFLGLVLQGGFLVTGIGYPSSEAREALIDGLASTLLGAGIGPENTVLLEGLSGAVDEIVPPRRD
ncbi:MAG: hypothetical protein L6427_12455 [Actinomycetia bacterium]|nr:hypothetical protein [Actinomycetes bacterium]